ncbi:MAG: single-stranded-DNA-specific exonuclease RecJ [Planctomycetes bacterium]|nr:single-stranded-DNA-specific exonuclease RecJ [Planctomycetota bacterium]
MPPPKRWHLHDPRPAEAAALAGELDVAPLLGQILLNRGLGDPAAARRFLRPDLGTLLDPSGLPDMGRAVERISAALRAGEKIVVYGDYDVDGVSATTLLMSLFRFLGREVRYYIPDRMTEGYSLSRTAIERFGREGVKVLITVDCGTTDVAEITVARDLGIDVIVTDHHEPGPTLPPAFAIVNPKLPTSTYPFNLLAGSGVAFKLVWGIAQGLSASRKVTPAFREFLVDSMAFAALGTVADVVPLIGENRVIAAFGLSAIAKTRSPGLRALLRGAGIADGEPVSATDVGFKIGPRINAGGRMTHASQVVELLLGTDPGTIEDTVERLDKTNRDRQRTEAQVLEVARAAALRMDPANRRSLVLAGEGWHPGVIGIVAATLVDEFHRPTAVISLKDGIGKGSARSIPGFHLTEAFAACAAALEGFGGHAYAAGFEIRTDRVEALRDLFEAHAQRRLAPEDLLPRLTLDAEIDLAELSVARVRELSLLDPCGAANPAPLLSAAGLRVSGEPRIIGKNANHLSFYVTQGRASFKAVAFGMLDRLHEVNSARGRNCALAFQPQVNAWRGSESVDLVVRDIRF